MTLSFFSNDNEGLLVREVYNAYRLVVNFLVLILFIYNKFYRKKKKIHLLIS